VILKEKYKADDSRLLYANLQISRKFAKIREKGGKKVKDNETKQQFIELRAKGFSFDKIADDLDVAKQTLINWSKEFEGEIARLEALELEALYEKYHLLKKKRIERVGELLNKVYNELGQRDFTEVETDKLVDLYLRTLTKLKDELVEIDFETVQASMTMGEALKILESDPTVKQFL